MNSLLDGPSLSKRDRPHKPTLPPGSAETEPVDVESVRLAFV